MTDLAPIPAGTSVDRYVVEDVLGRGGMAIVYRVRHRQLNTIHAMKVLTLHGAGIRQRLLQEGRIQGQLQHPNVVAVTDVVDVDGSPGIVMEFVRGPSLDRLIAEQRLALDQCDLLATGILRGVAAAHAAGLVHRDLKPANILVAITAEGPVPKIADFGLAKLTEADAANNMNTRSGVTMGTPAYMAPEQIRNAKGVDQRADVFALGAILYELVTGRRAFDGEDVLEIFTAVASGRYAAPKTLRLDLPERMERAIAGALVVDRDARTPTCDALLDAWRGSGTSASPAAFDVADLRVRYGGVAGVTAVPPSANTTANSAAQAGATFADAGGAGLLSTIAPEPIPVLAATVGPAPTPPPAPRAVVAARSGRAWIGVAVGVIGLILVTAALAGAGLVGAGVALSFGPPSTPTSAATEEPAKPAVVSTPIPQPAHVDAPVEVVVPVGRAPTPTEAPPAPRAPPTPAPEAAPSKPVASPAPPTGRVIVSGDAVALELSDAGGRRFSVPGGVPAGTYEMTVTFTDLAPENAGRITVVDGETLTITCQRMLRRCR